MNKKGFTLVELVVDCSAVHDESKKLEKAVHDALSVNGDDAGYAFWIAGEDGRYKLAQWCDTSSPRSKGIVGQYPDPVTNLTISLRISVGALNSETIDDLSLPWNN